MRSPYVCAHGGELIFEGVTHKTLGRQMINLVRSHPCNSLVETGITLQRGGMELNSVQQVANPPQPIFGVFNGHAANDSVNLVSFIKEKLSQVASILA